MNRFFTLGYGVVAYLMFVAAFLYAIGFVGDIAVPRSVDHATAAPVGWALAINLALLGVFAAQHSVMARPAFKRWWTRFVPESIERSTYVLLANGALSLLYWQWRTIPAVIWDVSFPAARLGVWALFWLGWLTVVAATFMINHFELFGLRQVYFSWRGKRPSEIGFHTSWLYLVVRHPLMLGFIIAFWATPTMTAGHLLFAVGTTAYILVAIRLEEHDLIEALGRRYRQYRADVPMLIPRPRRRAPQPRQATP